MRRTCPAVERLAPSAASRPEGPRDAPLDLEAFLREFDDAKLEALREAVEKELRRRGGAAATNPRHKPVPPKPGTSRRRRNPPPRETSLTGGQERWVRAALQSGASPAAIARQFGVGRNQVQRMAKTIKAGRDRRS